MATRRIVARQGEDRFLVDLGESIDGLPIGVVVDTSVNRQVGTRHSIAAIAARGYWEDYTPSEIEEAELLALVSKGDA